MHAICFGPSLGSFRKPLERCSEVLAARSGPKTQPISVGMFHGLPSRILPPKPAGRPEGETERKWLIPKRQLCSCAKHPHPAAKYMGYRNALLATQKRFRGTVEVSGGMGVHLLGPRCCRPPSNSTSQPHGTGALPAPAAPRPSHRLPRRPVAGAEAHAQLLSLWQDSAACLSRTPRSPARLCNEGADSGGLWLCCVCVIWAIMGLRCSAGSQTLAP